MNQTNFWQRSLYVMRHSPWPLAVAVGMIIFFAPHSEWHEDLIIFREAGHTLRHPYWARWLFGALAVPPEPVAFVLLSVVCTTAFYFATRVFHGQAWMVFTSFSFAWTLFYGQIDGIVVGGLALAWWALKQDRPYLIGVGLIIASIKPQLSVPIALFIWWWSSNRWKPLVIPIAVVLASLVQWGWWIPAWLASLRNTPDLIYLSRNLSLWPYLGPVVLLIWPVIVATPLPRLRKLLAAAAGTTLSVPYFPLPSAVLFLTMGVPWWGWLAGQLPILAGFLGDWIYYVVKLWPITLLLWALWPGFQQKFIEFKTPQTSS